MAVQRRVSWISGGRVDTPDMRSVESAVSNDFDQLIQAVVTNTAQGYIIRGFNILMANSIGNAASSLLMQVDPGALMHIAASQSGTVMMVPAGTPNQQLNHLVNPNVTGSFVPSSLNYVTVDYARFLDDSTNAQVYIWNPTSNNETVITAPRAQILKFVINISTATPTSNQLTISTVQTDSGNTVVSISDDRYGFGRLATGGLSANPFFVYPWSQGRTETAITSTSDLIDPFNGADKNLGSLKEWMNAIMTSIKEINGTQYWYENSLGSLYTLREDLGNTVVTGAGSIAHGIIPNATPILVTTGNINSTNQLTNLALTTGIVNGQTIFGNGIQLGTTVLSLIGTTVTMSQNALLNINNDTIEFYDASVITAPGQVNWDQPIYLDVIGSALTYKIATNYNFNYVTLSDDQTAYLTLSRGKSILPNLIFINGNNTVASVGSVSWTSNLLAGDFVKLAGDSDSNYYKIQTVNTASTVTLSLPWGGINTGMFGIQAQYALGNYQASATPVGDPRAIQIGSRQTIPVTADTFWLFLREDNSSIAKIYVRILDTTLADGQSTAVASETSSQLPDNYDEVVTIVSSGATPPTSLNGPIGTFIFTVTSANATSGAIYSNNGQKFSVNTTISGGTTLTTTTVTGSFPTNSGTLTKVSGTGDVTITFSSYLFTGATITLPNNTRLLNAAQYYLVNSAKLEVFLNGQELVLLADYSEIGSVHTMSNQILMLLPLSIGDVLDLRISVGGGSGLLGPAGPAGPSGAPGVAGHDAAGGPVGIATKTVNYSVLTSDNVILGNCASGNITLFMPSAATGAGHVFYFKKVDSTANQLIVQAAGIDLIDGVTSKTLYVQWEQFTFISDGTNWYVF